MTYVTLAKIAQQGGAIYFFLIFLAGAVYAYWPRNKAMFDHAARLPLDEED